MGGFMRLEMHYRIAKEITADFREKKLKLNSFLFIIGNLFPDLIHSYLWQRHEYHQSQNYICKKLEQIKKKPHFFSFHLGVLTHYICDFFCYSHSRAFGKNLFHHIIYELRQKPSKKLRQINLAIESFTIQELAKYIDWYESSRSLYRDDHEYDYSIAVLFSVNFLRAAY